MTQESKTEKPDCPPALRLTVIPFAGFYETFFSDLAEEDLRYTLEGAECLTGEEKDELESLAYDVIDFRAVHLDIARAYVESFNDLFKEETGFDLGLQFESMQSPREYNFGTDRIFCFIDPAKVDSLYRQTDKKLLAEIVKERFTSRSGFISAYDNDLNQWIIEGRPKTWDHNQIETLIIARLKQAGVTDDGFNSQGESLSYRLYDALQDERGNGKFSCLDSQYFEALAAPEKIARLNELLEKEREGIEFKNTQGNLPLR